MKIFSLVSYTNLLVIVSAAAFTRDKDNHAQDGVYSADGKVSQLLDISPSDEIASRGSHAGVGCDHDDAGVVGFDHSLKTQALVSLTNCTSLIHRLPTL